MQSYLVNLKNIIKEYELIFCRNHNDMITLISNLRGGYSVHSVQPLGMIAITDIDSYINKFEGETGAVI